MADFNTETRRSWQRSSHHQFGSTDVSYAFVKRLLLLSILVNGNFLTAIRSPFPIDRQLSGILPTKIKHACFFLYSALNFVLFVSHFRNVCKTINKGDNLFLITELELVTFSILLVV